MCTETRSTSLFRAKRRIDPASLLATVFLVRCLIGAVSSLHEQIDALVPVLAVTREGQQAPGSLSMIDASAQAGAPRLQSQTVFVGTEHPKPKIHDMANFEATLGGRSE